MKMIPIIHPGEILLEEYLKPMRLSQNKLANAVGVPPRRINEICLGKRGITANTALRLSIFFDMSAEYWLNIQKNFELRIVKGKEQKNFLKMIRPYAETSDTNTVARAEDPSIKYN